MSTPPPVGRDEPVTAPSEPADLATDQTALDLPAEVKCPECSGRLIDPEEMGYCPMCGYCRYVEDARRDPGYSKPKDPGAYELAADTVARSFADMPSWLSVLLGGVLAIMIYLIALDRLLPENSYGRAMSGLLMIVGGLVTALACQFWALLKIAPHHQELTMADSFLRPAHIWHTAVREVPATRWPIWLGAWGLVLALGAGLFVGGQSYWMPEPPANQVGWWE